MSPVRPSDATVFAVRGVTANILTAVLVVWSGTWGAVMVAAPRIYTQPRYAQLQHLMHGNLTAFGAVLLVAAVTKGVAALTGAMRTRCVATCVCAVWWVVNSMCQAVIANDTGDWPALLGTALPTSLFVIFGAVQVIYVLDGHSSEG